MHFLKRYCLNRRLRSFAEGEKKRQINVISLQEARSVCFFITCENPQQVEELTRYTAKNPDKKITVICYLPAKNTAENAPMLPFLHTISSKDVGWRGQIKKQTLKTIFLQQYDIFIDMNTKTDLTSLFLATLPKADFRIGGTQQQYRYSDFTLCADEQHTLEEYLFNLELYTSKLKGYN